MRSGGPAIAVVLCLLVAGCTGPLGGGGTATSTPTGGPKNTAAPDGTASPTTTASPAARTGSPTPEPDPPTVDVEGGELPVNATAVWLRFLEFRGLDAGRIAPPDVEVRRRRSGTLTVPVVTALPTLAERLGLDPVTVDLAEVSGPTGRILGSRVLVRPGDATADAIEAVLVHEFEHYVQPGRLSTPVAGFVSEGAATYVEVAYARQYLDRDRRTRRLVAYRTGREALKLSAARYYFGYRYVARRVDSPRNLSAVYADPPRTTSELLHGREPPSVPMDVDAPRLWQGGPRPMGELFVRVLLATRLNESTAASAAAGWANGTVVTPTTDPGCVWLLRTNDERNATQLRAAFARYLSAEGARLSAEGTGNGTLWRLDDAVVRLVDVDDRTLALVVGPRSFVENATVSGGETVTVEA